MFSASKIAHVEQSAASKPPFLTLGEVMPEALRSWEIGCYQFFMHKNIPEEDMDWYLTNQEEIDVMMFKEYMAKVCHLWLSLGWVDTVRCKMLASTQGQCPFSKWAIKIQSKNTLLQGTASHLPDVSILYHLESHMNTELTADYHAEKIVEEDLCNWIEKAERSHGSYVAH
ncbi:hypothetical protein BDR04DRAFT_1116616 [Suillus decipiens]|nr:hypothetical protein BDR04DRAFT_1116616 [Suillus decipiens]